MIDLKRGDKVKVIWRYKHSHATLTNEKEYEVLLVKPAESYRNEDKFQVLCDNGKKKWYGFNNTMFQKVESKAKQYTENQRKLMIEFVRSMEQSFQSWNAMEGREDRDELYESDKAIKVEHYLNLIVNDQESKLS